MAALDFEFAVAKNLQGNCIDVMIHYVKGKAPSLAIPLIMKEINDDECGAAEPPTFSLTKGAAQRLMDELWLVGVRPSGGEGNAGELEAIKTHLKDMRALVFELAGLKK